jgi:hypothetical protein
MRKPRIKGILNSLTSPSLSLDKLSLPKDQIMIKVWKEDSIKLKTPLLTTS